MPSNRLPIAPTILGLLLVASGAIAPAPPSSPAVDTPSTAEALTTSPAPQNPASEAPPDVVANPVEPKFGDAGEFVVSGLFLGLGPDMYTDLTHTVGEFENRRTFIGLSSIVGGWF